MPFYEYVCQECKRPLRLFFSYADYGTVQPICTFCESENVVRRIGRVALGKSEESRMDGMMGDSTLAGLDEDDPRSIGRFMRKMGNEMGEDMGDEFNEVVDRLEKGESPEAIEKAVPSLADDAAAPI